MSDRTAALKHHYRVERHGERVPGVTTVLDVVEIPQLKWASSGIAAETATANWDQRTQITADYRETLMKARGTKAVVRAKQILATEGTDDEVYNHWCRGEFQRQWNAKAQRGTNVHDIAELWAKGEGAAVPKELNGYVDALEKFHEEFRVYNLLTECVVLNRFELYGGRFDRIAALDHPTAFGTFMLDWKTGRHYVQSVAMQEVAYKHGELPTYDAKGALTGFTPLPDIDGVRAVYLGEGGELTVVDPFAVIPEAVAWRAFRDALELYKSIKVMDRLEKEDGQNDNGDE